ncbi:MAG TPA: hypothetical protein VFN67_06700 [Polyangiales bacterium]|nr:hypothetical protein [Polyangiales bacterium]
MNERTTSALMMDQALSVLRSASADQWVRGLAASLPLAAALLSLYVLEHVVGVRPPLPLFGVLCALAYWARFRLLSGLAREFLGMLAPRALPMERSTGIALFKTAMVAGIGSWCWTVCLWAAERRSFVMLLGCIPLLSVRGALAPSLLARAACAQEAGFLALSRAAAETRGERQLFAGVELMALFGMLTLFGNLYALAALVLLVSSSLLGLDVGFVTALIVPSNELVPLLFLGISALLLEPLRAAISALAFQRARERWQGADLEAAIDGLGVQPRRRAGSRPSAAARGLVVVLLSSAGLARAEPPARPTAADVGASDDLARQKARDILTRAEFQPSETDSGESTLGEWFERRLRARELSDRDASAPPRFELSLPPLALTLLSLALMLAVGAWLARSLRRAKRGGAAAVGSGVAQPTSAERVAEAARLAEQAQYAASLRALYIACLQALGRFDTAFTNGQLLQRHAASSMRTELERLTLRVERCSYGRQEATRADYEAARVLVERILSAAQQQVQP